MTAALLAAGNFRAFLMKGHKKFLVWYKFSSPFLRTTSVQTIIYSLAVSKLLSFGKKEHRTHLFIAFSIAYTLYLDWN